MYSEGTSYVYVPTAVSTSSVHDTEYPAAFSADPVPPTLTDHLCQAGPSLSGLLNVAVQCCTAGSATMPRGQGWVYIRSRSLGGWCGYERMCKATARGACGGHTREKVSPVIEMHMSALNGR